MKVCCCSLAGTKVCRTCPQNDFYDDNYIPPLPLPQRKVIREYDKKGTLIKETIIE
jgi:hypothetical protein